MRTIFRKIFGFRKAKSGRVSGISILRSILSVVCLLTKYTWRTEDGISCVRVCLTSVERKHSTALFTGQNWSHRLSKLLRVPVREDDSFPDYICRSCRRTVESVESKLRYLKERIMDSYKRLSNEPNASRKRPKPTSSLQGISPATAAARPPSKRTTLHRRQLFPTANEV